jgi:alkanesulfonate monooxygenase SsuD/methylene tetrahydromethanopterin reductase-like flavin-dependent oxidoreductase (luciferase family)
MGMGMDIGIFMFPGHRPETAIGAGAEWDLELIRWADELGYSQVWIGEHFTVPWEPCPAPDLLIARAISETEHVRLGAGSHSLPFHHPAVLAHRVAYLDHLAKGRLNFGIGASGTPSDLHLCGIDGEAGDNRRMMWESIDAILRLWTDPEPYESSGEFWTVNKPGPMFGGKLGFHLKPFQDPHPPISVSGLSPNSGSLEKAGERGYIPLSIAFNDEYLAGHWDSYAAGAAAAGLIPERQKWGVVREVFVAESDDQAVRYCLEGGIGAFLEGYWLPLMKGVGLLQMYKTDPEMSDSEVTPEFVLRTSAMVGSVETVVERIEAVTETTGGFGTLLQLGHDFSEHPETLRQSMELLAGEVLPRVNGSAAPKEPVAESS